MLDSRKVYTWRRRGEIQSISPVELCAPVRGSAALEFLIEVEGGFESAAVDGDVVARTAYTFEQGVVEDVGRDVFLVVDGEAPDSFVIVACEGERGIMSPQPCREFARYAAVQPE